MTKEQFIKRCEDEGLSWQKMDEIRIGFQDGLSIKQVKLYANKEFNEWQMAEIRWGFGDGLSFKKVELFARPELTWKQMDQIAYMLLHEEPLEEVKTRIALMILEN